MPPALAPALSPKLTAPTPAPAPKPPAPAPHPSKLTAPAPVPAPPPKPAIKASALPDLDSVGACEDQRLRLEALIKLFYTTAPRIAVVKEAKALDTKCFDKKQLMRLAMVAIPAACAINDKAAVSRFYALAPSASVANLCPKLLARDQAQ